MDLSDIKARIYYHLRDTNKDFFTDEGVEDWINDAYVDISARLGLLEREQTGTMTTYQLAFPTQTSTTELIDIREMTLGTEDHVEFVDLATWEAYKDAAAVLSHTLGRIFASNIELYPTPVSGTAYTLRYRYLPAALEDNTSTPALPLHMHVKLVYYAVAQGKYMDGDLGNADRFMSMYEQNLPQPRTGRDTKTPGPLSVTFLGGPFDNDVDSIHR